MANYTTCKNIDMFFDNNSEINLLNVEYDGKLRTFCRCGEVFQKRLYTCPSCNSVRSTWYTCGMTLTRVYHKDELFHTFKVEKTSKGFDVIKQKYKLEPNTKTEEFEIVFDCDEKIFSKDSSGLSLDMSNWWATSRTFSELKDMDINDIKKLDDTYFEGFETFDFKDFFSFHYVDKNVEKNTFSKYILYCYFRKAVPWLFNGEDCLNSCIFVHFFNSLGDINKHRNYKNFIANHNLQIFEKFLDCSWFYAGISHERHITKNNIYELNECYRNLLLYYLEHYKISYNNLNSICWDIIDAIRYCKIKEINDEVFIKYLKDNLITFQKNVVKKYEEDLEWLTKLKLTKTNENIRNINFLRNQELLVEAGYPEKKMGVFMDSFYDNPLKASYYLKSKKDLTKKELEEFIEAQTK